MIKWRIIFKRTITVYYCRRKIESLKQGFKKMKDTKTERENNFWICYTWKVRENGQQYNIP